MRSPATSKNLGFTRTWGWRAAFQMTGIRCVVQAMIETASSPITTRKGMEENIEKKPRASRIDVPPPVPPRTLSSQAACRSGLPAMFGGFCGSSTPMSDNNPVSRIRTSPKALLWNSA